MLKFAVAAKLLGTAAAIGLAAVAAGSTAQAAFHPGAVALTASAAGCSQAAAGSECSRLFDGGQVLYPGSAPITRDVTVNYTGFRTSSDAGLFLTHFASRSTKSSAYCTALDPASMLDLVISSGGSVLYQGPLSAFAAQHSDPSTLLALGAGHLTPGTSLTVTMSVSMNRAAGNAYMGCATDTDFAWFAAA